jgi:hypothetical protein
MWRAPTPAIVGRCQGERIFIGGGGGEEGGEVVVVQGGAEAPGGDAAPAGGIPAGEVERKVAQGGEVLGRVPRAHAAGVLVAGHVEDPVQLILNGLIANDKICVVRHVRLKYSPARWSSRGQRRAALPCVGYQPVGCENLVSHRATGYAAWRSYSWMSPPSTSRRWIGPCRARWSNGIGTCCLMP